MNREKVAEYIGNIDDRYLDEVLQHKGQNRRVIMHRKKLLTSIIAAAVTILLSVSVAAATAYTGLIGEENAFDVAATYVVRHTENEEERNDLANFILAGLAYDQSSEAQEVSFGLSGLRPVYNVKFKAGGYAYAVKVDAKTSVVLDVSREVDENWDNVRDEFKEQVDKKLAEIEEKLALEMKPKAVSWSEAKDIFYDYFGLHRNNLWKKHTGDFYLMMTNNDEYGCWDGTMTIDGYIYTASIDYDTGEISDDSVIEDPNYTGKRYRYKQLEGIVSLREARKIALDHLELAEGEYNINFAVVDYHPAGKFYIDYDIDIIRANIVSDTRGKKYEVILNAKTGELVDTFEWISSSKANEIASEASGIPADKENFGSVSGDYEKLVVHLESEKLGKAADVTLDAVTGEVINVKTYDIAQKDGKPSAELLKNQSASLEAPDGMISEAVALAIAFENSGVNDQCIWALKIDLDDSVYNISYWYGYDDFSETTSIGDYRTNTYKIDAVTGKILSFDALTPDDYIGEEAALAIAYKLAGIGKNDVEKTEVKLENSAMGYPQYSIALHSTEGHIYRYNLDAVSGFDHITSYPSSPLNK